MKRKILISILFGILAGAALLALYFLVMAFGASSWEYTFSEIWRLRYWIGALVLGFGIQIGLYIYLKQCDQQDNSLTGSAAGSTSASSLAMVACCAHHLVDILPLIGFSVAATFLSKYQEWFLALAIVFNLAGIAWMTRYLRRIKK